MENTGRRQAHSVERDGTATRPTRDDGPRWIDLHRRAARLLKLLVKGRMNPFHQVVHVLDNGPRRVWA